MNLIRYNPNRWFDFPFDRFFEDAWGTTPQPTTTESAWLPRVDIREEHDAVLLSAELPGVSKDEVTVQLENGVLTVSGEKKSEQSENENGFYRCERVYGAFKRSFRVPETVDAAKISAEFVNGVLKLTLPKRPEAAARQIEVKADEGVKTIKAN